MATVQELVRDMAHNQLRIALLAVAAGKSFPESVEVALTFPPRDDGLSELRIRAESRVSG